MWLINWFLRPRNIGELLLKLIFIPDHPSKQYNIHFIIIACLTSPSLKIKVSFAYCRLMNVIHGATISPIADPFVLPSSSCFSDLPWWGRIEVGTMDLPVSSLFCIHLLPGSPLIRICTVAECSHASTQQIQSSPNPSSRGTSNKQSQSTMSWAF